MDFQEYLLFRQSDSSKALPAQPWKVLTDTILEDTIYGFQDRYTDSNRYSYQYRIKIRDKFDKEGNVFGFVRATAYPPSLVKTFIDFGIQDDQSDTLTRNDSVRIVVHLKNKTRNLRMVKWAVGKIDAIVKETELDSTRKTAADTLAYSWPTEGNFKIYAISKDMAGVEWVDTMVVYVIKDLPTANAGTDTLVLTNTDINLHGAGSDGLGKIMKYEWAFGSIDTFYQTSTGDTTIKAPDSETDSYQCYLRVTDDDGKTDIDTVVISTKKVIITAPTASSTVSGMYKVYGTADPTLTEIQVKIADNDWVKASGVASWSTDIETRLLFPATSATISTKAFTNSKIVFEKDISVSVSNMDPLIGRWKSPDVYCGFTLYEGGGSTDCPLSIYWNFANGWQRNTKTDITVYKIQGNANVTVEFFDYNNLKISGDGTGTWTRQ